MNGIVRHSKGATMAVSKITIGYSVQLGGIAAGALFLGGVAAFYIGEKLRSLT
jgi:hypothetical protein